MGKQNKQTTYHDDDFHVEILQPPFFTKTGKTIDRKEAWKKGLWYGAINLWIISPKENSIVYQLRSPNMGWAPGKLDVSSSEHYEDLDTVDDALVKINGEIGKVYKNAELIYLGKKLNVGIGKDGTTRNTVNDVYFVIDESALGTYTLQESEVYAICKCNIDELLKVNTEKDYSFSVKALRSSGEEIDVEVNRDIFPDNYDNYHFKIAQLAKRLVNGETNLLY